jgi:hypothetical protein
MIAIAVLGAWLNDSSISIGGWAVSLSLASASMCSTCGNLPDTDCPLSECDGSMESTTWLQ